MKIGIIIGRIGGEDGVALETEKWIAVLERLGHEVVILAGELEGQLDNVDVVPQLAFDSEGNRFAQEAAFLAQHEVDEQQLLRRLDADAEQIAGEIEAFAARHGVDCLVSENANALPFHLALGMALAKLPERLQLPIVCHDHDFYWERGERYRSPFAGVNARVEASFPLRHPRARHAVINSAAASELKVRFGIEDAVVVPNVMDFAAPFARRDEYNADLRRVLGVSDDDILLFQITRIVRRKGIETAIELVHRLADPAVKLVITGTARDEDGRGYVDELEAQVRQLGLEGRVLFCGERFDNQRRRGPDGEKIYSLSDAYAHAAGCTYFSTYEGFGNAFVEALLAKVPIFVNDYEPVYWPDIGSRGFSTVMIKQGRLSNDAIEEIRRVLADRTLRAEIVEHNFRLGEQHFSYAALAELLAPLFDG